MAAFTGDASVERMSLMGDRPAETRGDAATRTHVGSKIDSQFSFVPGELAAKCRSLIESFHGMYGYVGLPDMLWLSDARVMKASRNCSKKRPGREARNAPTIRS
jgi:hypothetical protein